MCAWGAIFVSHGISKEQGCKCYKGRTANQWRKLKINKRNSNNTQSVGKSMLNFPMVMYTKSKLLKHPHTHSLYYVPGHVPLGRAQFLPKELQYLALESSKWDFEPVQKLHVWATGITKGKKICKTRLSMLICSNRCMWLGNTTNSTNLQDLGSYTNQWTIKSHGRKEWGAKNIDDNSRKTL